MSKTELLFSIHAPEPNGLAWARRLWDTYGFDYDTEKSHGARVIAWPIDGQNDRLADELTRAGIPFDTFEVDLDVWFGA